MSKLLKALKHLEMAHPEGFRPTLPLPEPARSGSGVSLHELLDDGGVPTEAGGASTAYADLKPAHGETPPGGQSSSQSNAETERLKEISLDALQLLLSEALATRNSSPDTTAATAQGIRAIPSSDAADNDVSTRVRLNQPQAVNTYERAIADIADSLLGLVKSNGPAAVLIAECGHCRSVSGIAHLAARLQQTLASEVLLVQSRSGNHVLERMLAVRSDAGLQEVLSGRRALADVVRSTSVSGLSYVGPGTGLNSERELQLNRLRPLAAELRDRFRLVLVNGGSADETHALSWSQVCDSTFLMLQLGSSGAKAAARAKRAMERAGARVAGCIAIDPAA